MTVPTAHNLLEKRNNPGYLNLLAVGSALNILSDGIRHYVEKKMKELHSILLCKLGVAQCLCTVVSVKTNPHVNTKKCVCLWAMELRTLHRNKKKERIPWHQSDSSKWHDPVDGYWEVAKIFMSGLGSDSSNVKDPNTTDQTGILNLMIFCTHFNVQDNLLKTVRDWRNTLAHSPNQLLSETDKVEAFKDILCLINDKELMTCKEVQDCRGAIEGVRVADISILDEHELQVLQELIILRDSELKDRNYEMRQSQDQAAMLPELSKSTDNITAELSNSTGSDWLCGMTCNIVAILFTTILAFFNFFSRSFKWFLVVSFLVSKIGDKPAMLLDSRCSLTTKKSPISHYQEFNFSPYLVYKGENFFGRKWLFSELEEIFYTDRGPVDGVLITGEPGSGKSALMSRLICSPFSSLFIHDSIIGYHLCHYAEKGKRSGARFVRNLADQISRKITEYSDRVANDEQIRRMLDNRCENYPTECFSSAIIEPLRDISEPDDIRYILIDALDECLEKDGKTSAILDILSSKISYFPKWLKVILTSRNSSAVTARIPQTLKRLPLDPTDIRNVEDIRSYITHALSKNSHFTDRLLEAMNLKSTTKAINSLIDELTRSGEGNFLVVKTTLQYMNESDGIINFRAFPTTLYATYDIFFKRHFDENDFRHFRAFFEVLLAAGSPLQVNEISTILKLQNQTQEISELVGHVASFLRFSEDGAVWIYHQSLAEWLIEQGTRPGGFIVSKSRGHQYIADFLFDRLRKRNDNLSLHELSELSSHVVLGGSEERHREALKLLLNASQIRDPNTGRCILHVLAVKNNAVSVLEIFLRKLESVDIPDIEGKTPAFYAACEGKTGNLKLFISKGADVNLVFTNFSSKDPIEILVQNKGMEDFNMMHVAAYRGHSKTVELLINSNVTYPRRNIPTPLQLAAGNGHLEVVKLLHKHETNKVDRVISLHHASARNHSDVVGFLLNTAGVHDQCLPCKPGNLPLSIQNVTVQEFHLTFCETALYAAVSRGHLNISKLLLNYGDASLECRHRSGKTPLMAAVERNDTAMVELLLDEGADVEAECGNKTSRSLNQMCDNLSLYKDGSLYTLYCEQDDCACGNKAVHLAARYGLWEMAKLLLRKGNAESSTNCNGEGMLRIAIRFDQDLFLHNIYHAVIKSKEAALIFLAVNCDSTKILKLFNPDSFQLEMYGTDITPLMLAVRWSPYPNSRVLRTCSQVFDGDLFSMANKINEKSRKRIATIKLLVKPQKSKYSFINKKNKDGGTALHIAAMMGFTEGVKCLVQLGSNVSIMDEGGKTPLTVAMDISPMVPDAFYRCYTTSDGVFTTCNTTSHDETVAYLISLQDSNIKICDSKSAELLLKIILKQMPLSFYSLIKIGVDMNCDVKRPLYPFLYQLNVGGEQICEVFKIFGIRVSVKCGLPFRQSELHLMSYLSVPENFGNLFKPAVNKRAFPLQRWIDNHPKGVNIIDECRDNEGYLAVHRAAQGGNIDAIKWFISLGVDISQRTWSGLTALDLSILYLESGYESSSKTFYSRRFSKSMPLSLSSRKYRLQTFERLLLGFVTPGKYRSVFQCDSTFKELSPLHIAAVKGVGMLKYVYKKARRIVSGLPLNCTNEHWIFPHYLAYFHESIESMKSDSNRQLKNAHCDNVGTLLQYPDLEAEYHIIYNYFYQSPDEIENIVFYESLSKLDNYDVADCPGFFDFLPKQTVKKVPKDDSRDGVNDAEILSIIRSLQFRCVHQNVDPQSIKMLDLYRPPICTNQERLIIEIYAKKHYCPFIMQQLQEWFTRLPRKNRKVSTFIAERMGWKDTSEDGDVQFRWPFYFLYKKMRNDYKDYEYLETLNEGLEISDGYYRDDDDDEI